jgi:hypothetical protein
MDISREDLYHRVWATPMRTVAKEFGVSDVGLSKACRGHAVPTPPPGYWTQLQHGKAPKRPPLPAAPHGNTVSLSDDRSAAQRRAAPMGAAEAVQVEVAATTDGLASFAKATLQVLSKAKPSAAGLVSSQGAAHFKCLVSPALVQRAARILDAIERKLPDLGAEVSRGNDKAPLCVSFDGQRVEFTLAERYTRTEHIPESERNSPYPRKQFVYHLTGELKFAIEGYYDGRKTWSDGSRSTLEEKLPEVLGGLAGAATAMRKIRQEREEQKRRWEEQARIRAEEEARVRRRAAFRDAFAQEAQGWERHKVAVAYLAHLRQRLAAAAPVPEVSAKWLAQAEQALADLDPTELRVELLRAGCEPDWASDFGKKLVKEERAKPYM